MNFADRVQRSIKRNNSVIVAGFDPVPDQIPKCFWSRSAEFDTAVFETLTSFYYAAIEALADCVAVVKPNIAFYEQFGISGLRAFQSICAAAKERSLPVIADIKRGDIGSTAQAYSAAFLSGLSCFGKEILAFDVDAITVNPFLGFDTLEPFVKSCKDTGKGLFVLVRTSNSGAAALQSAKVTGKNCEVSESIATWITEQGADLKGSSGYSSLGAVVGATHPAQAAALRKLMPHALFLIPGFGAQGGSAQDAVAGFDSRQGSGKGGGLVHISRGLFAKLPDSASCNEIQAELRRRAAESNSQINAALGDSSIRW